MALGVRRLEQLTYRMAYRVGGNAIHQADLKGPGGGDFFGRDEQLQRSSLPDQTRETLRTSPASHKAESGAAMAENGVGRGNTAMARKSKVKASAHAVAFDGGDHGRGIGGDRVHEGLSHEGKCVRFGTGELGDLVEVGSDGEKPWITSDDQRLCFQRQLLDCLGEG